MELLTGLTFSQIEGKWVEKVKKENIERMHYYAEEYGYTVTKKDT
jgi:hypothetical protein